MENLTPLLEQLAEKFGTTVEHLWEVMITQASIFVSFSVVFFFITAIVITIMIFYSVWFHRIETYDSDVHEILLIVGWMISFVLIILCVIFLYDVITAIKNPEYWALERLMKFLK